MTSPGRPTSLHYVLYHYWDETGDPRTAHYPLMANGPWTMLSLMATYLLFVNKLGPQMMKSRPAFDLRWPMFVYNVTLVALNAYFFVEALICIRFGLDLADFHFPDRADRGARPMRMIASGYLYFLTKFLDLFDTVFFVLRKKYGQVTGLHLYHHTSVPILGWLAFRISPTAAPLGLFPIVNSLIHVVMYTYYALAALGPQIRPHLWWKRYITVLQLYQFVLYGVYFCFFIALQSGYPAIYVYLGFVQPPLFFYLFYAFYKATYHGQGVVKSRQC